MQNTNNLNDIAASVLTKIAIIDPRFKVDDDKLDLTIQAWAEILDVPHMWKLEALQAVANHYKKSEFIITPAAVVKGVQDLPFTSSRERITAWLIEWMTKYPLSNFVQTVLDIEWYPESRDRDEASIESRNWLLERLDSIVDQFMEMGWETAHAKGLGAPLPPSVDPFGVTRALE